MVVKLGPWKNLVLTLAKLGPCLVEIRSLAKLGPHAGKIKSLDWPFFSRSSKRLSFQHFACVQNWGIFWTLHFHFVPYLGLAIKVLTCLINVKEISKIKKSAKYIFGLWCDHRKKWKNGNFAFFQEIYPFPPSCVYLKKITGHKFCIVHTI